MAIKRQLPPVVIEEINRTKYVELITPRTGDYSIRVEREILEKDEDGVVLSERPGKVITRKFVDVTAEVTTLQSGKTLTNLEIVEAMEKIFDRWNEEEA